MIDGAICITHPWEAGRDNAPDWDGAMASIDPTGVQPYVRRDTSHVDPHMRPTKYDYDRYIWLVEQGKSVGWDQARLKEINPFRVADPTMTFILLRANRDLRAMARILGEDTTEIDAWITRGEEGAASLWNPDLASYDARDTRSGDWSGCVSNASFLCWYGGVNDARMAPQFDRIMDLCRYGLPSHDPSSPKFDSQALLARPHLGHRQHAHRPGAGGGGRRHPRRPPARPHRPRHRGKRLCRIFRPAGRHARRRGNLHLDRGRLARLGPQDRGCLMGSITLKSAEKWFGELQVIKGVDLEIQDGEFVVFVGPSGCGKSTLLRMIGGLEETSRGQILIDGGDVTDQPPSKRGLTMVFQSYALYPHMSVRDNMGFSLKTAGAPKAEIEEKVMTAAEVLKLEPYLDRRPKALSGGQRQRVAIGRSIVRDPTAFLFDEPLSNLDAALRVEMRYEIAKLHQRLNSTMIYVTHDQVEAMTLADRIVVLEFGVIAQVGTPRELYENPANLFVAQFIGSPKMNVLPCTTSGGQFQLDGGRGGPFDRSGAATQIGIRPEHIDLLAPGEGQCDGTVDVVEYLGADSYVIIDAGPLGQVTVRAHGDVDLAPGQPVGLGFQDGHRHFFDAQGKALPKG